ncbi:MAG TPA: MBL fold metallo-hydrolase [Balneolales bacterium]|nr:MBL fold metallo-hydrolase [Balneolales bacterium]
MNLISSHLYPRVYQLSLPTPFPIGPVNVYLIVDDKIVLIDAGPKTEAAFDALQRQFRERKLNIENIDEIWITHAHADHFGLASRLANISGAEVLGHPGDRNQFEYGKDLESYRSFFNELKLPELRITSFLEQFRYFVPFLEPMVPTIWLDDGMHLDTGKHQFEVVPLPGHSPGHVGFFEKSGGVFSGDVLLESTSTNALIGFDADTGDRLDSLLDLRLSIQRVSAAQYIFPGHGNVFDSPEPLAEKHLTSQEDRMTAIIGLLTENPLGPLELSEKLFPEVRYPQERYLAFSEVMGYLDWGMRVRSIRKIADDGPVRYRSR